jgi:hypothetical protein
MDAKTILEYVLGISNRQNFPDIHLNTGHKPIIRNTNGEIMMLDEIQSILTQDDIIMMMKIIVGEK